MVTERRTDTIPVGVRERLEAYGDHPSIGLAMNAGMEYLLGDSGGVIAYRRAGRYLFQFGGVFGPSADRARLLRGFLDLARGRGLRVCAVQLRDRDVDLYHRHGFRLNQMGLSYTLRLDGFTTVGTRFMKLRNKVARARRAGVQVYELGRDLPATPEVRGQLDAITAAWVRGKGRTKKLYDFLVNHTEAVDREGARCFVARQEDTVIAFIVYLPSFGQYSGLIHDLSRRLPTSPPGVMELINLTAIARFQAERVPYLNFGLTPFAGVEDRLGSHSRVVSAIVQLLGRYGAALYPASSQVAYKLKWDVRVIEPEYFAFQGRFRLGCLWHLLRLTQSI
jgi:lysylphosphatidylglycerol synthetase-like protein (DUF2156 family)